MVICTHDSVTKANKFNGFYIGEFQQVVVLSECGNMMSAFDIAGFFHQPTVLAPE